MSCAVGIMAYNEEANIASAVRSVLDQTGPHVCFEEVVVVASGCTDLTCERAVQAAGGDARLRVMEQPVREGKAAAVSTFLQSVPGAGIVVLVGGDTRPEPGALEALLAPFDDPGVGMTGGRPVPVNDTARPLGRIVHLLWGLHHAVALRAPKLGEMVAFRRAIGALPEDTSVDEAVIEALVRARGLRLVYAPGARVRMKGPATVADFLEQRRRIHSGHLRLRRAQGHAVSTLSAARVLGAAWAERRALRAGGARLTTLVGAAGLEAAARALGAWDARGAGRTHRVWKAIASTKDLTP